MARFDKFALNLRSNQKSQSWNLHVRREEEGAILKTPLTKIPTWTFTKNLRLPDHVRGPLSSNLHTCSMYHIKYWSHWITRKAREPATFSNGSLHITLIQTSSGVLNPSPQIYKSQQSRLTVRPPKPVVFENISKCSYKLHCLKKSQIQLLCDAQAS